MKVKPIKLVVTSKGLGAIEKEEGEPMRDDYRDMLEKDLERISKGESAYDILMEDLTERLAVIEKEVSDMPDRVQADVLEAIAMWRNIKEYCDGLAMIMTRDKDKKDPIYVGLVDSMLTLIVSGLTQFIKGPSHLRGLADMVFKAMSAKTGREAHEECMKIMKSKHMH